MILQNSRQTPRFMLRSSLGKVLMKLFHKLPLEGRRTQENTEALTANNLIREVLVLSQNFAVFQSVRRKKSKKANTVTTINVSLFLANNLIIGDHYVILSNPHNKNIMR